MTVRSMTELLTQATADLPDNSTGLISPAKVRDLIVNFIDSVSPGYGALQLTGPLTKALTAVMSALSPFSTQLAETAGVFTVNVANGSTTRLIATVGLSGATQQLTVSGGVRGPNNSQVTVELFRDGLATGFKSSVTCAGGTDVIGFNISALNYSAGPDTVFDVRASSVPNGSHDFLNVILIAQSQPVRAY